MTPRGETFDALNPATSERLVSLPICDAGTVDEAVAKARQIFESGAWSHMEPTARKNVLIRLTKLMRRELRELAVMESLDSGKPVAEIEAVDLPETLHCLEWYAELADKRYDEVAPTGDDAVALVVREPVGVVGCVLPWNFPLLMLAWKIGPALAAIRDIGPGGHYLGHAHTLAHFQDAFFAPELFDNNSFEQWEAEGAKDVTARALEMVRKLLGEYEEPRLDEGVDAALREFIAKREQEIPSGGGLSEEF